MEIKEKELNDAKVAFVACGNWDASQGDVMGYVRKLDAARGSIDEPALVPKG